MTFAWLYGAKGSEERERMEGRKREKVLSFETKGFVVSSLQYQNAVQAKRNKEARKIIDSSEI